MSVGSDRDHLPLISCARARLCSGRGRGVTVVGGGQAGLSVSHYLKQLSADHVVLEQADKPGEAWRNHRWDSRRVSTRSASRRPLNCMMPIIGLSASALASSNAWCWSFEALPVSASKTSRRIAKVRSLHDRLDSRLKRGAARRGCLCLYGARSRKDAPSEPRESEPRGLD